MDLVKVPNQNKIFQSLQIMGSRLRELESLNGSMNRANAALARDFRNKVGALRQSLEEMELLYSTALGEDSEESTEETNDSEGGSDTNEQKDGKAETTKTETETTQAGSDSSESDTKSVPKGSNTTTTTNIRSKLGKG